MHAGDDNQNDNDNAHVLLFSAFLDIVIELHGRVNISFTIKLLESPIPATTAPSQKAHFDDISGTKRGTIDPLVSKRPEKNSE